MSTLKTFTLGLAALTLATLTLVTSCKAAPEPQAQFMRNVSALCNHSFSGKVVSTDAVDEDWRSKEIIVGPIACVTQGVKMPLAVGDNTSRTWFLLPTKNALTLKHEHTHTDDAGNVGPDAVSWYGGTAKNQGSLQRQEFPVDIFSIDLFKENGLSASVTNTWAMEVSQNIFAYELSRPPTAKQIAANENGRFFRIEFDLTQPLDTQTP